VCVSSLLYATREAISLSATTHYALDEGEGEGEDADHDERGEERGIEAVLLELALLRRNRRDSQVSSLRAGWAAGPASCDAGARVTPCCQGDCSMSSPGRAAGS
jgi:hypothetical protein